MKIKKFFAVGLAVATIFAFAKENKGAKSYKTRETDDKNAPVVYFSQKITPESLVKVFDATGWKKPSGKCGIKVSTGEPPASNYLRPSLIKNLVQKLDGTIVECNTAYGGSRSTNASHKEVAKEHGFLDIAPFDLLDEEGFVEIPVKGGKNLVCDYVGKNFKNYGSFLVLSHFKGHAMAGFGGAIKNLSIGFGSGSSCEKSGKLLIHSGGESHSKWTRAPQDKFTESMAEAAKAVCDAMQNEKGVVFVNVLNRLSVDCDCNGNPAEPDMHDIGVLASTDPLAIDQASIDLAYSAQDAGSLIERIESRQGLHVLEHAEKIGLGRGKRNYRLVCVD